MNIQLSDHFTYKKLFLFTMPPIMMMIFTSIYSVVDGYFVSNYIGKTPFAALNLIYPFIMIMSSVGFMFGAGGSALIAKTLGQKQPQKANMQFSLIVYTSIILAVILSIIGIVFIKPISSLLGAQGEMKELCVLYGTIILIALPFFVLQFEFQSLFITAEKPKLGLWSTVASGVTNMVLDWLFIAIFNWGLAGAAIATALAQVVGGVIPLIYFSRKNTSLLKLSSTLFDSRTLIKTFTNGSSELMSNLSMSLVCMLYNIQLLKYAGENGVSAYGVLMYVSMIFIAVFIGYSVGTAPVISFHFGAKNHAELKNLLKKSTLIIIISSILMVILGEVLAKPLSLLYVGYDTELLELTQHSFVIYSFSFLFAGFAIFGSSFFTALNDGLTSAVISFLRTLVFQVAAIIILPLIFDTDGIWYSLIVAEVLAVAVTVLFLFLKRKKYKYW
jgi:putative MATE family efflux protein